MYDTYFPCISITDLYLLIFLAFSCTVYQCWHIIRRMAWKDHSSANNTSIFLSKRYQAALFSPTISKFWRYILRFVYLHYVHKEDITSGKKYKIKDSRTLIYIRLLRLLLFTISLLNIEYISLWIILAPNITYLSNEMPPKQTCKMMQNLNNIIDGIGIEMYDIMLLA